MKGIAPEEAGFLLRAFYRVVGRKVGQLTGRRSVPEPVRVAAHHPRILLATGLMDLAQEGARALPASVKLLASIQAARRVGCPY